MERVSRDASACLFICYDLLSSFEIVCSPSQGRDFIVAVEVHFSRWSEHQLYSFISADDQDSVSPGNSLCHRLWALKVFATILEANKPVNQTCESDRSGNTLSTTKLPGQSISVCNDKASKSIPKCLQFKVLAERTILGKPKTQIDPTCRSAVKFTGKRSEL